MVSLQWNESIYCCLGFEIPRPGGRTDPKSSLHHLSHKDELFELCFSQVFNQPAIKGFVGEQLPFFLPRSLSCIDYKVKGS